MSNFLVLIDFARFMFQVHRTIACFRLNSFRNLFCRSLNRKTRVIFQVTYLWFFLVNNSRYSYCNPKYDSLKTCRDAVFKPKTIRVGCVYSNVYSTMQALNLQS